MGLPVTVYRSTDAGAPQITPVSPSKIINLLKKCLVEGYGDKDPLGWTLEYEDAGSFAAAFRNSTEDGGSGGFVKIWSATGTDAVSADFRVKVAKGMTGINTFVDDVGYRTYNLESNQQANGRWQLIGTARSFWLIIEHSQSSTYELTTNAYQTWQLTIFIGDIESSDPNDASPFVMLTPTKETADDSTSVTYISVFGGSSLAYCGMFSCDGSASAQVTYSLAFPFESSTTSYPVHAQSQGIHESLLPVCVARGVVAPSNIFPSGRGAVPGLFQSDTIGYSSQFRPLDLEFDGQMFTRLLCFVFQNLWLNIEEWYV